MDQQCLSAGIRNIGVMWKTVSEDCNLACDYCYYSTCHGKPGREIQRIDVTMLEKFIREYMAFSNGIASFAWQGGEPLLAGYVFFEDVVRLQRQYAPRNTLISNALQTNGTLITERFAKFFKRYHFLLGVSLDGPKEIHDLRRVTSAGAGSFEQVMKGISHLRTYQVDFNVLTVIHQNNVTRAQALFDFYKQEQFHYIQFIPCMKFQAQQIHQAGEYEITPEQYGNFLCEAFDLWYNQGNPQISVRFFDNMLSVYIHREAEACIQRKTCGSTLILEQNGDAYPCDFYMHSDWKIGNVGTDKLTDILSHPHFERFAKLKPTLPEKCKSCRWLKLCYGGCPRNRRWSNDLLASEPDYFCESYQQLFAYAHQRMEQLSISVREHLFRHGVIQNYQGKVPGRNDPCACGSGKKYKHCCLQA